MIPITNLDVVTSDKLIENAFIVSLSMVTVHNPIKPARFMVEFVYPDKEVLEIN